jgi:hypothetical protein
MRYFREVVCRNFEAYKYWYEVIDDSIEEDDRLPFFKKYWRKGRILTTEADFIINEEDD